MFVISHIQNMCQMTSINSSPIVIYEVNSSRQNSFTLMNFKKIDKLMLNKLALLIILQTYLYMTFVCGELTNYKIKGCSFRGKRYGLSALHFFFLLVDFCLTVFFRLKIFNEAVRARPKILM